jgi:pimeloyl-ACP methyl ester carboxylesterase
MRLFFVPGFGEEESIFEKVAPHIPGEKTFLNPWLLAGNQPRPGLNALVYARELSGRFGITKNDVVIGHSTGGWVALHLKHLTGCTAVQIASWTDPGKVIRPVPNRRLIYWASDSGLYFNSFVKRLIVQLRYRNKPSREIFSRVFTRLSEGNKHNVTNQLRLIFNPVPEAVTVQPDLRIHARADSIIRFPDEPVVEVPGDHFTLYTHPEKVYRPVLSLLQELAHGRRYSER